MSDQTDGFEGVDDADVMVARALAQAVLEGGRSLAREPRRVQGMMNDVLGAESRTRRAEVDAVVLAAEEAIPEDMLAGRIDTDEAMERLHGRGLDDGVAGFAVDVWRYALGMLAAGSEPPSLKNSLEPNVHPGLTDPAPPSLTDPMPDTDSAATMFPRPEITAEMPDGHVVAFTSAEPDLPGARSGDRRTLWVIGAAAALIALLVGVLVVVNDRGDGDDVAEVVTSSVPEATTSTSPSTSTTVPPGPIAVDFEPESTTIGEMQRTWTGEGEEFVGILSFENPGDAAVSGVFYEIVPTSLAATTSVITSTPEHVVVRESVQPMGLRSAQESEPVGGVVIGWPLSIEPGATVDVTYRVDVGTEVTDEMLEAWSNDHLVQAQLFAAERDAAPSLAITTPPGTVFTAQAIEIAGTVDATATLTFLGNPVTVNADGTWAMQGELPEGPHALEFVATSRYGVTTSAAVDVIVELPVATTAPPAPNPTNPPAPTPTTPTPTTPTPAPETTTATTAPPPPPPPAPTVTFGGPSQVNACTRFSVTVSVANATGGTWRTSWGWSEAATHASLSHVASDNATAYTLWFEYTATGPGGSATQRKTVTVSPDPRVGYVRDINECHAVAG